MQRNISSESFKTSDILWPNMAPLNIDTYCSRLSEYLQSYQASLLEIKDPLLTVILGGAKVDFRVI